LQQLSMSALVVEALSVTYGDHVALDAVDLAVQPGQTVSIIGPNGSGKSTLLAAIAGLVEPTSGHVTVERAQVALVLQSTDVDPSLPITVLETVTMARYARAGLFRRLRADDRDAVRTAMSRTDVDKLAQRQLHDLSGGQRQRVLVAQGLAQEAELLLLDEPLTGLDVVSQQVILDVVQEERAGGRSVVMTTHSLQEAASCDIVVLLAGRMIAAGSPAEVIVAGNLQAAFGAHVLGLASGQLLLDDHHDHHHHDPGASGESPPAPSGRARPRTH
jgi:manganese transport system ATP-binding protein